MARNCLGRGRAQRRDGIEQDPLLDAVPHLADDDFGDVLRFERRRAPEEISERYGLCVLDYAAGGGSMHWGRTLGRLFLTGSVTRPTPSCAHAPAAQLDARGSECPAVVV